LMFTTIDNGVLCVLNEIQSNTNNKSIHCSQ
jgi:hypothetical protein